MSGSIAPTSGHSPFVRAALPPPASFHSFPSTSFSTPSSTNPYVTDPGYGRRTPITHSANAQDSEPSLPQKPNDVRGQTLEEMYSAPENTLEIEVREPRTQGETPECHVWIDRAGADSGTARETPTKGATWDGLSLRCAAIRTLLAPGVSFEEASSCWALCAAIFASLGGSES